MNNISIKCLKSEKIQSGTCRGQFLITSLRPGQGITIGNQLRRVLLGDLGGIAISAVRIAGVSHEFATIPGVREDILEILLNLKGIVFKSKTQDTTFGRLKIQGPTVITANCIQLPSNIEIVNKRAYQNISVEGGGSSTVTTGVEEGGEGINNNNDNDASSNKSIVLKKMKRAKQHWWNRNKNVEADNTNEVHTEVYHNGQKEEPSSASATEQQEQQGNKDSSANESSSLPAGVIVQTQEDGTVLIKLPPPRMNLKEPKHLGSSTGGSSSSSAVVQDLKPLGSSTSTSVKEEKPAPFVGDIDNGDTVYIKLPYQQQQNQQHRTLTEEKGTRQELEPPLRGAAPQLHNNHHQFHHPPLLPFTDSGTHKEEDHDHPNMMHALRQDFNTWMDKHGKNYGSHEEKEHRFSVWRKNHVR